MGMDRFGPFDYFREVAANLKGNHVITTKVSMIDGIEVRAKQLDKEIKSKLDDLALPANVTPKVHLIGHSMGGLDARRLVCAQDDARKQGRKLPYEVLSVTTVSTPHHGSPAGNCAKSIGFTGLIGFAAAPIVGIMKAASGAMEDLTPERMASFNQKYKDVPTVKYYSVMSTFKPWFNHLLYFPHKHIKNWKCTKDDHAKGYAKAYGENDGLVSFESAQWGIPLDIVDQSTSHVGVIGWGILGIFAGDSNYAAETKLYPALVRNIAMNVVDN